MTLPWGPPFGVGPIDGPATVRLGPFERRALPVTRTIPAGTPPGRYYYTLRAETPAGDVIDEDTFEFTVEAP